MTPLFADLEPMAPDHEGTGLYRIRRTAAQAATPVRVFSIQEDGDLELRRLYHDHAVARSLPSGHALPPQALLREHGRYLLVYEPFDGVPLSWLAGDKGLEVETWLAVSRAVVVAVRDLHAHNWLHLNLNPTSILVHPDTREVRLVDFRIACPKDQTTGIQGHMEGNPLFMAPEQTGRIDQAIGPGTDLYALGGCLHLLALGRAPYGESDPLELMHAQLARHPPSLRKGRGDLPVPLARILERLLEKPLGRRYPDAEALLADLAAFVGLLPRPELWSSFQPGTALPGQALAFSRTLYGRERERRSLEEAVQAMAAGEVRAVWIRGGAGTGKTALAAELRTWCMRFNARCITGKFDQYQRNRPFAAAGQISRELVRSLLAEDASFLEELTDKTRGLLGDNLGVLMEVLPDLHRIFGDVRPVPEVGVVESETRLMEVFRIFNRLLSVGQRPVVLFIDDLHWADPSSCAMLRNLATDPVLRHWMLICAYRDGEMDESHAARDMMRGIEGTGVHNLHLTLEALPEEATRSWLADLLSTHPDALAKFSACIHQKTGGNPFFLKYFMRHLHQEGLLVYRENRGWCWDLPQVQQQPATENVVDLITLRLQGLSPYGRKVLMTGACMGRCIDTDLLAEVLASDPATTRLALEDLAGMGLLSALEAEEPLDPSPPREYVFAHDRIQQAAYLLLAPPDRMAIHARAGRLLKPMLPSSAGPEGLFSLCNHLNQGLPLLTEEERAELAQLNLRAAAQARRATDYDMALGFLDHARSLLPEDLWTADEQSAVDFALIRSACHYLKGNFVEVERILQEWRTRATGAVNRAKAHSELMVLYENLNRFDETIAQGIAGLALLGESLPLHPRPGHVFLELAKVLAASLGKHPHDWADHTTQTDVRGQAALQLLVNLFASAYFRNQPLLGLAILRMVRQSMRYGNTAPSALAYAFYGMMLGSQLGRFRTGLRFAETALRVNRNFGDAKLQAQVQVICGALIYPWSRRIEEGLGLLRLAIQSGPVTGDLIYAGYAATLYTQLQWVKGERLPVLESDCRHHVSLLRKVRHEDNLYFYLVIMRSVYRLMGRELDSAVFDDQQADPRIFEANLREIGRNRIGMVYNVYCVFEALTQFLLGNIADALTWAEEAEKTVHLSLALPQSAELPFWHSMILYSRLAAGKRPPAAQRRLFRGHRAKLKRWSEHAPDHFRGRYLLLLAEHHRVGGRPQKAIRFFEQAIQESQARGYAHVAALAMERSGTYLVERNQPRQAGVLLREAKAAWLEWGGEAVAARLERLGETPVGPASPAPLGALMRNRVTQLDLASLIKASRAISGEIELDSLLARLAGVLMEHAGANRCILLNPGKVQNEMIAFGDDTGVETFLEAPRPSEGFVSTSVVNTSRSSGKAVCVSDAISDDVYVADPYVRQNRSRSILCLPIQREQRVLAYVYLENSILPGMFTRERMDLLEVLAAQAAVSMVNARLYGETKRMQREFQGIIEHAPTLLLIHLEGELLYANELARKTLGGLEDDRVETRRLLDLVMPESLDLARLFLQGTAPWPQTELCFRGIGGEVAVMEVTLVRKVDFAGQSADLLLGNDITERRRLERDLLDAGTIEQERIARDLHDGVGQILSAIGLRAKLLSRQLAAGEIPPPAMAQELVDFSSQAAKQARSLAHGLDPLELEREGLCPALVVLAERTTEMFRVPCATRFSDPQPEVPKVLAVHLYRIAQEALHNAVRHGHATRIILSLSQDREEIRLEVSDNGVGMPETQATQTSTGLRNMRHRARLLGGQLILRGNEAGGVSVECRIPLSAMPSTLPQHPPCQENP